MASFDFLVVMLLLPTVLGLLALGRFPADIVLLVSLGILLLTNILTPVEALAGFSNQGLVTIALLYVVVAGLRETGAIDWLSRWVLGRPRNLMAARAQLLFPVALLSAFVNNSPVVAMFTSAVQSWCKRSPFTPSQLLLPLSYASILGGTCTLVGTSTNLVVDGLMRQGGFQGFSLFELAWVGVPLVLVGCIYLLLFSRFLLADRMGAAESFDDVREYTVEMVVSPECELIGQTIEQAGLRHLPGLFLVEVGRAGEVLTVVSPRTLIQAGDQLVFAGAVASVVELRRIRGLEVAADQLFKVEGEHGDRRLFEAVVSGQSPCAGKSIRDARFRHRYNAAVLAVARNGQRLTGKLGDVVLRAGDTLLLEAQKGFLFKFGNSREFLLISRLANSRNLRYDKAPLALAVLITMLGLTAFGVLGLMQAALLAVGGMLASGCLTIDSARKSIDYRVLLVIACAFGLGAAIQKVGLAELIAAKALAISGGDAFLLLVAIYLVTVLLTESITNNAAAIVMFPIAVSAAQSLGVNAAPFAVAVMVAASASFVTPIGYQTNLMVQGPGGYRFVDYVRLGLPLSILVAVTALTIIPRVWAF
ncbi:SLC13 family permease [Aestuariirhabdus sp. LZHN29]|uniref:SLC13 family permease n=1 Tax=Aestuariirhabdus sp. LZHN29 TaxID=3417462 RepID=UPI003CF962B9